MIWSSRTEIMNPEIKKKGKNRWEDELPRNQGGRNLKIWNKKEHRERRREEKQEEINPRKIKEQLMKDGRESKMEDHEQDLI